MLEGSWLLLGLIRGELVVLASVSPRPSIRAGRQLALVRRELLSGLIRGELVVLAGVRPRPGIVLGRRLAL